MYLLLSNRDGVVVRGKLSEPRHLYIMDSNTDLGLFLKSQHKIELEVKFWAT